MEVRPPFSGHYLEREEPVRQVVLAVPKFNCSGGREPVERHYLHTDEGVQEIIDTLRGGDVPSVLLKTPITVECVVYSEPVLPKKVDERRLKKIGWGSIHTDPDVLRPKRQRPGFWSFLWWRIRDALEDWGLLPRRRR